MIFINSYTNEHMSQDDIDTEIGYTEEKEVNVNYVYVIDEPGEYKEVIVAEYPATGGKDVEFQEIKPEIGHYEMLDMEGNKLPYYVEIPLEELSKTDPNYRTYFIQFYYEYTPEQIAEREQWREEMRIQGEIEKAKHDRLMETPDRVDQVEGAQDDIILLLADIVGGA